MNPKKTIDKLLAEGARPGECIEARVAWVEKTMEAWEKAQREMDKRCEEALDRLSEEEFERLCDEEQAKVCAFLDPLKTAADHDKWPRHLHVGGI